MTTTTTPRPEALTDIDYLNPALCDFYRNDNGFLCLRLDGTDHSRVQVLRSLPLTEPDICICVQDMEQKELGILETLTALPAETADLVREELTRRYYCPILTNITSIKEKMGFHYFDVTIGSYKKTFSVKDISKSIKELTTGGLLLTDVDGNRYLIPDLTRITPKCARRLEPYLH